MLICPIPRLDESPKSLLNRYFSGNRFSSLHASIGDPSRDRLPTTQVVFGMDSSVQNLCDRLHRTFNVDLSPYFYVQTEGFTLESPLVWKNCKIPFSFFDPKSIRICPLCVDDRFFHQASDFTFINSCHRHNLALYNKCPSCNKGLNFALNAMPTCRYCNISLNSLPLINLTIQAEKELLSWVEQGLISEVESVLLILNLLKRHFPEKAFLAGKLLDIALNIVKKKSSAVLNVLSTLFPVGDVPNRLLLSPIFAALVEHRSIIQFLEPSLAGSTNITQPDFPKTTLRLNEVEFAFNVSQKTITAMKKQGLLIQQRTDYGHEGVTVQSTYDLVRSINAANYEGAVHDSQSCALLGRNVIQSLHCIKAQKVQVENLDWAHGLMGIVVRQIQETTMKSDERWISIVDFAVRAGTYPDAIRRLILAGFITPNRKASRRVGAAFHQEVIDRFCEQYCFISEIAKRIGRGRTILSAALSSVGVLPVSGPTVDGALTPLYLRSQVEDPNLNLAQLIDSRKFKCKSGRKPQGTQLYDKKLWVSSKEINDLFGLCPVALSALVEKNLIRPGVPVGRETDNSRYYTRKSVEAFQLIMSESVLERDAIEQLEITRNEFLIRFIRSGFCKVIKVGKQRLVSKFDVQRMHEDCRKYLSLASANRILGTPKRHFYNLLKTKRIDTVTVTETTTASTIHLIEREKLLIHGVSLPERNIRKAMDEAKSRVLVDLTPARRSNC